MTVRSLRPLRKLSQEESGSVLIFGLGLSSLSLLLTALVITYASVWSQKITLQRISDAAVLSAVQAVDATSIYRDQLGKGVNLDSALAKEKVKRYLKRPEVSKGMPDVELVSLVTSGSKATIKLTTLVHFPFSSPTHSLRILVTSSAIQRVEK